MREVFAVKSWVFWWAGLTATIFLQEWLLRIAEFFRNRQIFSPETFPFSIANAINGAIDSAADALRASIGFDPSRLIIDKPIPIPNAAFAVLLAIVVLAVAIVFYIRALRSEGLGDDILALFILYFVIRMEGHLIQIATSPSAPAGNAPAATPPSQDVGPLAQIGNAVSSNPQITFWVLMFFLVILVFFGEGLDSKRSFWRGLLEAILVAILFLPTEAAGWVAFVIERIAAFGGFINSNLVLGLVWGVVGLALAATRLYSNGSKSTA